MSERVAFVTGASRGIGRALALGFANEGYHVAALARSEGELNVVAKEGKAGRILPVRMDVGDPDSISAALDTVRTAFGKIDVLVNNAGMGIIGTLNVPSETFESALVVNLSGPFRILQEVVPMMVEAGSGTIINIASRMGKIALANSGAYAASKFGLVGLTESLYRELAPKGIKVTAICPSWVDTGMAHDCGTPLMSEEMIQPDDIMETVRWLLALSPAACVREVVIECRGAIN
jgi:NAD(P)-dependent dehydrogenase (short-subunit alcohol dehydrogenase family)